MFYLPERVFSPRRTIHVIEVNRRIKLFYKSSAVFYTIPARIFENERKQAMGKLVCEVTVIGVVAK